MAFRGILMVRVGWFRWLSAADYHWGWLARCWFCLLSARGALGVGLGAQLGDCVWLDTGLRFPWLGAVAVAGDFMGGELGGFSAVAASSGDIWWRMVAGMDLLTYHGDVDGHHFKLQTLLSSVGII